MQSGDAAGHRFTSAGELGSAWSVSRLLLSIDVQPSVCQWSPPNAFGVGVRLTLAAPTRNVPSGVRPPLGAVTEPFTTAATSSGESSSLPATTGPVAATWRPAARATA